MSKYNPVELLLNKRDGQSLSPEEIEFFIAGYLSGEIAEYQMSAMLMACYFQGLAKPEIAALTKSYIDSGKTIAFGFDLPVADKHSTGGVGDKISLMLAPIAASLGLLVPMISGRGLGHTGGTLDKLESIPGFKTGFSMQEFKALVEKHGYALVGQSSELVPADKRIYALRDVTATVESPGLITASIMSKKIAEASGDRSEGGQRSFYAQSAQSQGIGGAIDAHWGKFWPKGDRGFLKYEFAVGTRRGQCFGDDRSD